MYNTDNVPYQPIRNGRYFDVNTDLNELVASSDSSGGDLKPILKRLLQETKRTGSIYQITNIRWESPNVYGGIFEITIQITHEMNDYAFVLNQYYPFQAPLRIFVNGAIINHANYAALEWIARSSLTIPHTSPPPNIRIRNHAMLCDNVKRELGKSCSKCIYCKLYKPNTWTPAKFLMTCVNEYLAMRTDVVDSFRRGIGREKLMKHRVELPEVIIDEILGYI